MHEEIDIQDLPELPYGILDWEPAHLKLRLAAPFGGGAGSVRVDFFAVTWMCIRPYFQSLRIRIGDSSDLDRVSAQLGRRLTGNIYFLSDSRVPDPTAYVLAGSCQAFRTDYPDRAVVADVSRSFLPADLAKTLREHPERPWAEWLAEWAAAGTGPWKQGPFRPRGEAEQP